MKYKTKEQQLKLCYDIYSVLSNTPMSGLAIAEVLQISPKSKITHQLLILKVAKVISSKHRKGYYKTSLLSKEAFDKIVFDVIKYPKRYHHKKEDDKVGKEIVINPITHRKCRNCEAFLPASRYFKCYDCQPEMTSLDDIDEDFIYVESGSKWESSDDVIAERDDWEQNPGFELSAGEDIISDKEEEDE